ncbi:uncharacterized protein CXQ87_000364 [Candidozyma duobushaemuli]|uniref:Amino acid transporter transmembrane domain-containing protein n=1 Tax=Candidozyma duobushaemuli TaxID=1231522 RepID=A0A2V1AHV3_9ASCO|nr:uncharacterized protein CXQ87_000364 [[Candida] duobushaemulonis]PVH17478.1 hypothetical protein CXQ87_000364 [[Candida] duobushaemulonis]
MGRATIKSGSINLLNTIIGAGILAMPYGLRANGIIFGSFLIAWSSLTSAFGLYLQNKVAKYTQQQNAVSYFSLCQLTYPQLSVVFDGAIAIKCFGVGVSYLVIIGDLMPKIMESLKVDEDSWWMERNLWITLFMVLMVAPLSYLKKLDSLKYTSLIALFSVVYLMCLVIEHYIVDDLPNRVIDVVGPKSLRSTLSSFPIFVFAYTCHQNMFAIINELEPSEISGSQTRQGNMVIRNAISVACASYLLVGIIGYLTFGNKVDANIITMYPKDSIPSLIGRLCIVVMVSLSFPFNATHVVNGVLSHKLRNSQVTNDGYAPLQSDGESMMDETFVSTTPMEGAQDTDGHDPIIVKLTTRQFYVITTGIVVLAYLVAISVKSLARVLAFVGSTGSTSISFILPGLFGYMLIKPLNGATSLTMLEKFCKYGGFALSVWGVIVMVVCLFVTIFLGSTH